MPVARDGLSHRDGVRAGRGNNHARRFGAMGALTVGVLALAIAAMPTRLHAQAMPPVATSPTSEDPLVQRGVPAEATAENAVVARDRALASGQRIAYERMAAALGLPRGISDSQIEGMVRSLVIESERVTPRGYSARITVNFNPQRVGVAGGTGGVPGSTAPAPSATPSGPTVATLEAVARYRSFPEWVEITRRLGSAPAVARYEVVTVSGEMARLRLALRSQPPQAATELAQGGLLLGTPAGAMPGEGWQLGLAGTR